MKKFLFVFALLILEVPLVLAQSQVANPGATQSQDPASPCSGRPKGDQNCVVGSLPAHSKADCKTELELWPFDDVYGQARLHAGYESIEVTLGCGNTEKLALKGGDLVTLLSEIHFKNGTKQLVEILDVARLVETQMSGCENSSRSFKARLIIRSSAKTRLGLASRSSDPIYPILFKNALHCPH